MLLVPLLGAMGGAIAGSFLATLCVRWPRGEQSIAGRSSCDGCGRVLAPMELVPLVSALLLRGRCRGCRSAIDLTHPLIEAAAAALVAAALLIRPDPSGVALALFWLLLLPAAVLDARHFWLPDRLTIVIAASGLAAGGFVSRASLGNRLAAGALAYAMLAGIAFAYHRATGREGLGGGDPKLLAAIGLWVGIAAIPVILLLASLTGLAAALLARRSRFDQLPFGTFAVVGAILWSGWSLLAG